MCINVLVGLSGGVDSAVAAAILKEKGYKVTGVTMKIWDGTYRSAYARSACFGKDEEKDLEDIRKLCQKLDIQLYEIDLTKEYKEIVIEYFRNEYQRGRTPNPCIICNSKLKFKLLLDKAFALGLAYDYFATGHYARIDYNNISKRYMIEKALDLRKDQTYFLVFLTQQQLSKVMFPLGEFTKDCVRKLAKKLGLNVHDKVESQDFYSGDKKELLGDMKPGNIIDKYGRILGQHKGIANYTIGQRRGLKISSKIPLYVIDIDPVKNQLIVGEEGDLYRTKFLVRNVNWISIEKPFKTIYAKTRIRYKHYEEESRITFVQNEEYLVEFVRPQRAVTPGQIAAFYDEDILLGGGIID